MKYIIFSIFSIMMIVGAYTSTDVQSETAYIQLTKKRCLGTCPVYDLFIYANGVVVFDGIDHVAKKGRRQFQIPQQKLNEIKTLLDNLNLESLKTHHLKKARDLPVTNLIINGEKLTFQGQNMPTEIEEVITTLEALI